MGRVVRAGAIVVALVVAVWVFTNLGPRISLVRRGPTRADCERVAAGSDLPDQAFARCINR